MDNENFYTRQDVIDKYKPMFTEWSLAKLIREKRIKTIRIGRRVFISKSAVEEFIKSQEEKSILGERGNFQIV